MVKEASLVISRGISLHHYAHNKDKYNMDCFFAAGYMRWLKQFCFFVQCSDFWKLFLHCIRDCLMNEKFLITDVLMSKRK